MSSEVHAQRRVAPSPDDGGSKGPGAMATAPATLHLDLPQAEGLEVINMTGEKVKLASFWKDQKLVIVFLRRFDCQTCFSYIVLFAHLRPILTATNTRIIFLTCHENLSEVQVFLTSFAYWLRTLQPPDDPDDDQKTSGRVGVGTRLGALPGELFLDPGRNSYRVFGIGNQLRTYQRMALFLKLNYWSKTNQLKKFRKVKRGNRMKTYTESSRAVWREWFQRASNPYPPDISLYAQSPGIVVMENGKMVYKFVCKDQIHMVPNPDGSLANALACRREDIQTIDDDVQKGLEKFVNLVGDPNPTKKKVQANELVLEKILGSGKESEVFKAKWMGIPVAVKYFRTIPSVPHSRKGEDSDEEDMEELDAESIQSFSNEVSMLMSLRHPNIIGMMGFGVKSPNFFLITEFMPRGSLFQVLEDPRITLSKDRRKSFVTEIADAMAYLHGCKPQVIHQDLKSLNVLVGEDWTVKVSDFGIARDKTRSWITDLLGSGDEDEPDSDPAMNATSSLMPGANATMAGLYDDAKSGGFSPKMMTRKAAQGGTLQWMAPEHLTGKDAKTTTKSDVYAYSVILWEVATRKKPWKSVPFRRIVEAVLKGERPPIPATGWEFAFRELVDSCWAHDPVGRPEFAKVKKLLKKINLPG